MAEELSQLNDFFAATTANQQLERTSIRYAECIANFRTIKNSNNTCSVFFIKKIECVLEGFNKLSNRYNLILIGVFKIILFLGHTIQMLI